MLAGLWGSGNGTNTFGENVGTIGKTNINITNDKTVEGTYFYNNSCVIV